MRKVMVEVTEDGRIMGPPGVRLRVPVEIVELADTEEPEARRERLNALFEEIDARLDGVPRKP